MSEQLLYNIATTYLKDVGDTRAKNLIAYCGSSKALFEEKKQALCKIPGIGEVVAGSIIASRNEALLNAEKEMQFIEEEKITPLFYTDNAYPQRLLHCADSPILLFYKGNADLNQSKIISIVGSRNASEYGKSITEKIIKSFVEHDALIVSGLAYGIDICAHKFALEYGLQTVGVLAHGLDKIYPAIHENTAQKMLTHGGLLSEFTSKTNPDRENFPKRNRIVAGICDAVIVVESKKDGGSLITADIANSYNRDVFAVPGNLNEPLSEGCNYLIKTNKASLLQDAKDVSYILGWQTTADKKQKNNQIKMPLNLSDDEEKIMKLIGEKGKINIDELTFNLQLPMSKTSSLLLNMEFNGLVKSLPGKQYQLA